MLNRLSALAITAYCTFVPSLAFAQDEAAAPDELGELIPALIAAAKGGEWSVFVALVIMVLVFLATKVQFIDNVLPKAAKPWVAVIAGVLSAIAATVYTTGDWVQAILGGLVTGAAASGLWELIGKKFLKKSEPAE